jgi:hypothetical protein
LLKPCAPERSNRNWWWWWWWKICWRFTILLCLHFDSVRFDSSMRVSASSK